MTEDLRVVGAIHGTDKMEKIVEELKERGYKKEDIHLVASHHLTRKLEKAAHTYEQDDIDPTDDEQLTPNESNGLYIHFKTSEELKEEYKHTHNNREGSLLDRFLDNFSYGDYLKPDEEMLIKDYQEDLLKGAIILMLDDRHVAADKKFTL